MFAGHVSGMKRLSTGGVLNLQFLIVVAVKGVKGVCIINDNIKQ